MYIVVSRDPRLPEDLVNGGFQVEQWTPDEFFMRASADDGLEVDEGIWYNVEDLTAEIYEGLEAYIEAGIAIIYYRFDDRPSPNFTISHDVKVYAVAPPEPEEEEEPEPVVVAQPKKPVIEEVQEPVVQQLMSQQPVYPQQQPMPQQPVYPQQNPYMQQPQPQQYQQYQQPMQPQMPYQQQVAPAVNNPAPAPKAAESPEKVFSDQIKNNLNTMLQFDDYDAADRSRKKGAVAKVILFGSSKGGTGKTFTCLTTAYWYAKQHPRQRIALADFDIIDGQVGITINKLTPTLQDYWKVYNSGKKDYVMLDNIKIKSEHFTPNIDFFLAPAQDIPTITNDNDFWNDVFEKLIQNYDVVFFDSGIDYLGKPPISKLYKISDKIVITSNPSINSVKSVIKMFKTLSGQRVNNVFRPGDKILKKINIVLTRTLADNPDLNSIVELNLSKFAPIIAKFGNIDDKISKIQWLQDWSIVDNTPEINNQLSIITKMIDTDIDDE